jgi:hypothetical protein
VSELSRAELAKELGSWPATARGWAWGWRRCGRDGNQHSVHDYDGRRSTDRKRSSVETLTLLHDQIAKGGSRRWYF